MKAADTYSSTNAIGKGGKRRSDYSPTIHTNSEASLYLTISYTETLLPIGEILSSIFNIVVDLF